MDSFDYNVESLSFFDHYLKYSQCETIFNKLATNKTVLDLNLTGNDIGAEVSVLLLEFLETNQVIQRLSLQWNCFGNHTAMNYLTKGLRANHSIQYLDLRNNTITGPTCEILARFLAEESSLLELDLRWNNLGEAGGTALLRNLENNTKLEKCHLSGNHIPLHLLTQIEKLLERNRKNKEYESKYKSSIEEARNHGTELERELDEARRGAREEVDQLQTKITGNLEEIQSWQARFIKLEKSYKIAQLEHQETSRELEAMRSQVENFEKKAAHFEQLLTEETTSHLHIQQDQKKNCVHLETTIAGIELQNQELTSKNEALSKEVTILTAQNKNMEDKILHLESVRASEGAATEARIEQLRSQFERNLDMENKKTEQIKKTLLSDIHVLQNEKATLQEERNQLRSELISTKVKYEEKLTTFETELRQKQNEGVSHSLMALEEAVTRISRERDSFIQETKQKEDQMQSLLKTALKDRDEFETWIAEEKERTRKAEEKIRCLQLELAQLQGSLKQRDQQIKSQSLSLQQAAQFQDKIRTDNRLTLERILLESGQQCELLERQCREKDGHVAELTNQNHKLNIENQALRKEAKRRRLVLSSAFNDLNYSLPEEDLYEPVEGRRTSKPKVSRQHVKRQIQRVLRESPIPQRSRQRSRTPKSFPRQSSRKQDMFQKTQSKIPISPVSTNTSQKPSLHDAGSVSSESEERYEMEFSSPDPQEKSNLLSNRSSTIASSISIDATGI